MCLFTENTFCSLCSLAVLGLETFLLLFLFFLSSDVVYCMYSYYFVFIFLFGALCLSIGVG